MDGVETILTLHKTIDSVNHRMLCLRLGAYGITPIVEDWVQALLSDVNFRVRVKSKLSDFRSSESGVPQGPVFGSTLFLICVNYFPGVLVGKVLLFVGVPKQSPRVLISKSCDKILKRPGVGQ